MPYSNSNIIPPSTDVEVVSIVGSSEPVTLAEAKLYLSVTNTQEDSLITGMIETARATCERTLNSDIRAKQRIHYVSRYEDPFNLYYAPIESIDLVEIDGVATTEYEMLGLDNPKIMFEQVPNGDVRVTYTTKGRSEEGIKQGVLSYINYLYRGRDEKVTTNYRSFLKPYMVDGYYGQR